MNPNATPPRVIIRHCDAYDSERIRDIVRDGLQELGLVPHGPHAGEAEPRRAGDMFPHAHTRPEFGEGVLLRAAGRRRRHA